MAQKIHVELVDDVDGSPAAETVSFGLDGVQYQIDLSEGNATALREALAPYIGHGRRAGGGRRRSGGSSGSELGEQVRALRGRDPRVGALQRLDGARPRPGLRRGARGVRRRPLSPPGTGPGARSLGANEPPEHPSHLRGWHP